MGLTSLIQRKQFQSRDDLPLVKIPLFLYLRKLVWSYWVPVLWWHSLGGNVSGSINLREIPSCHVTLFKAVQRLFVIAA